MEIQDFNAKYAPVDMVPFVKVEVGYPCMEIWEYMPVVGMMIYLAGSTRPDISYAVHQCARFTHAPRKSHVVGIKRILRYLQGTKDKGLILNPSETLQVDCYVDADFAGLWNVEQDQDPLCVKSRTGYIICFMGCPLTWVSKLQTQIALSTMEGEYLALSQVMRDLIAIREIFKKIETFVIAWKCKSGELSTYSRAFTIDKNSKSIFLRENES